MIRNASQPPWLQDCHPIHGEYEEKSDNDLTTGKADLANLEKIIELRKTQPNKADRIGFHDRRSSAAAVNEVNPEDLTSQDLSFQKEIYARPIGHCKIFKLEKPFVNKIFLKLKQNEIKDTISDKYYLNLKDYLKCIGGELIKIKYHIFYKLNFESKSKLSILLDRKGDFIIFLLTQNHSLCLQGENSDTPNLIEPGDIKKLERILARRFFKSIDLCAVKETFKEIIGLNLYNDVKCREGNIVVFDGHAAYELHMEFNFGFSVFLDRGFNFLDVIASDNFFEWENLVKKYIHNH